MSSTTTAASTHPAPLLPSHLPRPLIGIIGGSGLYAASAAFTPLATLSDLSTPFGAPSSPVTLARAAETGAVVAFIARHGMSHEFTPTGVPVRANLSALKLLGCEAVLAFSAVGSLREELAPGDFVVPGQVIDRTHARAAEETVFGEGCAGHASMADPFSRALASIIHATAAQSAPDVKVHVDKTLVTIEGPRFSTRAESHLFRAWGCDLVNMSTCPEAFVARELELPYQVVCMVTDYDCWRHEEEAVSVEAVMRVMRGNAEAAGRIMVAVVNELWRTRSAGDEHGKWKAVRKEVDGMMRYAVMTKREAMSPAVTERMRVIFPHYFLD